MKLQTKKSSIPPKMQQSTDAAIAAKQRILQCLDDHPEISEGVDEIRACLRFADFSYELFAADVSVESVDRTQSLVNGPLFTSDRYPQPQRVDGKLMFPVMQLDMGWINLLCDRHFEPGLLQLWWDGGAYKALCRLIPLCDANANELKPIQVDPDVLEDGRLWIPEDWSSLQDGETFQILECKPYGMTCPSVDIGRDWLADDQHANVIDEKIWTDLEEFSDYGGMFGLGSSSRPKSKLKSVGQLFGSFRTAQLSAYEIDSESCLMNISWATGYGNIFVDQAAEDKEKTYSFYFDN
jgi:hypothetical protein